MKLREIIIIVAALILCSCNEEPAPSEPGTKSIHAVIEDDSTKTNVTDSGHFTWDEDDKIWIQTTSGAISGNLSSGAGTTEATFTYELNSGSLTGRAIYPYNDNHVITDNEIHICLPAEYDLSSDYGNTKAAMYAVISDSTLIFNHLAGVMSFHFKEVPTGTNQLKITVDKKINGVFTADITETYPIIQTSQTENQAEQTITINFNTLVEPSDLCFYIPLPVGSYSSLALELNSDSGTIWSYSKAIDNTIKRNTLLLMPEISLGDPEIPTVPIIGNIAVGYVTGWERTMPEPSLLTHINYAYADITEDLESIDLNNEDRLTKIIALKSKFPHLKVLLSIGENETGNLSAMAADETHREQFCKNCLDAIQKHNLDGIDIYWEYPTENLKNLVCALRTVLGSDRMVTIASAFNAEHSLFPPALPYIEFVSIITYGMGRPPYHNAGLYPSSMTQGSCSEYVDLYHQAGVPYEKMVLGIPFHGHGNGLDYSSDRIDYKDVPQKELSKKGLVKKWDDIAQVPYLTNNSGEMVISYDDEISVGLKTDYVKSKGILGVMYWNIEADDYAWPLSKAISSRLLDGFDNTSEEGTYQVTNSYMQDFMDQVQYKDRDYSYTYVYDFPGGGPGRADLPQPVILKWEQKPDAAILKVWEDNWSREYKLSAGANKQEVSNLVPNTTYHYAVISGSGTVLTQSSFKTTGSIHQVFFPPEVRNARDLGGWKTLDGKTVVYRKLYRGGAVGGLINNIGKEEWRAEGIKAELDLREASSSAPQSPIGSDIEYLRPGFPGGYSEMLKEYQPGIKECFEFIARNLREERPIFIHCTAGRDRTGTMAMLILGLLGVSDGDISKEYELTYFAPEDWSMWLSRNPDKFLHSRSLNGYFNSSCNYIWSYGESTFAGCVEKYLLSIGVNQQDINDIRSLMLRD